MHPLNTGDASPSIRALDQATLHFMDNCRVVFSFTKKEISTRQGQYLFLFFIIHLSSLNQENTSIYVCANATYLSRFRAMVLITSSITMGFDRCPFIPASREACTSSAKALAVIAMIGIVRPSWRSSRLRMAFVASYDAIVKTRKKGFRETAKFGKSRGIPYFKRISVLFYLSRDRRTTVSTWLDKIG